MKQRDVFRAQETEDLQTSSERKVSGKVNKRKIFAFTAMLIGIIVMLGTGYRLFETRQTYQQGSASYDEINALVKKTASIGTYAQQENTPQTGAEAEHGTKAQIYIPDFEIDFDLLQSINKDSSAWLYSPNTVIDYPVMRADNYTYYLSHLSDGTVNANGSLFIDYNNASDFSDDLTVIYGHHMKSGSMFGSLKGYKNQAYYEEHPYMYLYTPNGNHRIDILYGSVIDAKEWSKRAFMHAENTEELLAYAKQNTTFDSEAAYEQGDKIIVLSTCSYEFNDARYFVVGVVTGHG